MKDTCLSMKPGLCKDQLDDLETELNVARLDVEAAREQYDRL